MSGQPSDSLEFCSMDYWDYFVELECLQNSKGKDLQLAAELGKTLLERNKELETGLKQQQTVIEDQSQEIEYLSKQSVALREVNDSRLRVYEQLEVSIQELEVTNRRLQDETTRDKKRIRSLTQTVEYLEQRITELQTLVDELRASEQASRLAAAAAAAAAAGQNGREDGRRDSETQVPSTSEQLAERVMVLEQQLTETRERERRERERRQWAEAEVATAQEVCTDLRQEMAALRERSVKLHTLAEEVHALEEHRLSPFLRHCSPRACSASPQMAAESHAVETDHPRSVWGEDAVRWSPGPAAASSSPSAPGAEVAEAGSAPASLISDLDAHYRVLLDHMDKYEWLLTSRPPARAATPDQPSSLSLLEELRLSAPPPQPPPPALALQGVEPLRDSGPASLMMLTAVSDGDASSSGFSDGSEGSRAVSRATQTPDVALTPPPPASSTPLPQNVTSKMTQAAMTLRDAGTSPQQRKNTVVRQHTPQYRQLFQEIFQVLKKPVVVPPALSSGGSQTVAAEDSATAAGASASTTSHTSAVNELADAVSSKPDAEVQEDIVTSQAAAVTEASPESHVTFEKAASHEAEPCSRDHSLQATLPVDTSEETVSSLPELSETSELLSRVSSNRSRSTSATRTFSYAEEYDRRLRASTPAAIDGASDSPLGVAPVAVGDEFPLLVRPSEEVAKLRLLERSYAEALKAGRRCFYRPTLL